MIYQGPRLRSSAMPTAIVLDAHGAGGVDELSVEFFDEELFSQANAIVRSWGGSDLVRITTAELFGLVTSGEVPPFRSVINFSIGLTESYRFAQGPIALEIVGVPYSGPAPFSILLCRDKQRTKAVVENMGHRCPPGVLVRSMDDFEGAANYNGLFPVLVKPNDLGGSVGVASVPIYNCADLCTAVADELSRYRTGVLVEHFVQGVDATVLICEDNLNACFSLGLAQSSGENLPLSYVHSFESKNAIERKWRWKLLREVVGETLSSEMEDISKQCWSALECRDIARFDFRVGADSTVWFIEANGQPDLGSSTSYVRDMADASITSSTDDILERYLFAFFTRIEAFESH